MKVRILGIVILLVLSVSAFSQRVGLVLSGGGALGISHIGVIKALEENGIPIDYITGTSAGAMVGSMYASGMSPEEMEAYVSDEKFALYSNGGVEKKYQYFFRKKEPDASWVDVRFSDEMELSKLLPTNFTNAVSVDFESMRQLSAVSAAANYNFDSLFVPFRCVAADISSKTEVVFSKGHLNQAVRASMTYPGYLKPITVDGKLLFDGGLYNNFPSNVMYDEFFPDIIIGVNFTDTAAPPDEDDVISQLKTMIINRAETSVICDNGILIEPSDDLGVFDFGKAPEMVNNGYVAAMTLMDSIKSLISRRIEKSELTEGRSQFRQKIMPIIFDAVEVKGVNDNQVKYIKNALIRKNETVSMAVLKKRYFRLVADEKLKYMYPLAKLNNRGNYTLIVDVQPEKSFGVKFGGVFSSRPINTGYLGLEAHRLGKFGLKLSADSYFGKFYGSVGSALDIDANYKLPINLKLYGIINRWDYFKSFATFFEDVKPSYIIENEKFVGADISVPVSYFGKLSAGYNIGQFSSNYYQSENFSSADTADATFLDLQSVTLHYQQSTLNRKMFPTEGGSFSFKGRYFWGYENNILGSVTSYAGIGENIYHGWYLLQARLEKYFSLGKKFSFGVELDGVMLRPDFLLNNYTATVVASPAYQPIPESRTYFIPQHVSHDYFAGGIKAIYRVKPSVDIRLEGYMMQPYAQVASSPANLPYYNVNSAWGNNYLIGTGTVVYDSPLGPISLAANYYEARTEPWSFIFKFGYLIFNRRFVK